MRKSAQINVEYMAVNEEIATLHEDQTRINALEDADERATAWEEFHNKHKALRDKRTGIFARYTDAIEEEEQTARQDVPRDGKTPEQREYLELRDNFSLRTAFEVAYGGGNLGGAEKEFAEFELGQARSPRGAPVIPLSYFDPGPRDETEVQKFATTLADGARDLLQNPVLARVFDDTASDYMGITPISVGVGVYSVPVFATGGTPSTEARDAQVAVTNTSITVQQVTPSRLALRYQLNMEDTLVLGTNEIIHRADMLAAMRDGYDDRNISALAGELTDPTAATTEATWTDYANAGTDAVDGTYATSASDVRILMPTAMWRHASKAYFGGSTPTVPVSGADSILEKGSQLRATNKLTLTSNEGDFIVHRARHEGAVAPIWGGVEIIQDNVTGADRARTFLTAAMYFNFVLRRSAKYQKYSRDTA